MGVFIVQATAPNGNSMSRPVVAVDAVTALAEFREDVCGDESDISGFTFEVTQCEDADGSYELALLDAERRRLEHEWYRMPARKARRR